MTKALEGIRIIDFTHAAAGTTCTMMLAAMGAEVIKIEPPWGEITRAFPPLIKDYSPYFFFLNRNKKDITLDLKNEKALKVVKQLIKKADIVVENFGPGAMERLGLSYDSLKEINPELIYASISGFGQYGPYSKRLSFDNIAQASSGFTSLASRWEPSTPPPEFTPQGAPEAIADTVPGLFAVIAILAALNYRNTSKLGQYIDVAQADAMISIEPSITFYSLTGNTFGGNLQKAIGGIYRTKDGYVTFSAPLRLQDRLVTILKRELNSENVEPEDAIRWAKEKTTEDIVKLLVEEKIPVAPINTIDKVIKDEHFLKREMIVKIKHEKLGDVTTSGFPIKFSKTPGDLNKPAPLLGEHTAEVLKSLLNYSNEEINELRNDGAI